jgi:hypothetical protein
MMIAMSNKHRGHAFVSGLAPRPRTETELKRRNRALSYSDANIAVQWLNASKGTAAYRRVFAMRRELEELSALLDSLRRRNHENKQRKASIKKRGTPPRADELEQGREALIEVAQIRDRLRERHNVFVEQLARYRLVPVLACDLRSAEWQFNTVPKMQRGRVIHVSDGNFVVEVCETAVALALCRLAVKQELFKVRLCAMCNDRWKVSERKMDRFCSQQCRERFRLTEPELRDRHARQQREYRERRKRYEERMSQ